MAPLKDLNEQRIRGALNEVHAYISFKYGSTIVSHLLTVHDSPVCKDFQSKLTLPGEG